MRALVIVHDLGSLPSIVGERLEHHGIELDLLVLTDSIDDPHSSIEFPDPDDYDMIVPMGAIWSVYDEEKIGSWVQRELDLLVRADELDIPVLGICFGGQALAAALGGASVPASETQIGWHHFESKIPEIASGPWMEWHSDQITVPPGSEILAADHSCVQAFRIRKNVGTQFHPEVTLEHLEIWLDHGGKVEAQAHGVDVEALLKGTKQVQFHAKRNADRLVDWFLSDVAGLIPAQASPLIGLPGRRKSGTQIQGFEGELGVLDIDMYLADYARGIIAAGGIPIHIPMDLDPRLLLPHLDGILLSGGADIHPSYYDQEPTVGSYELDRDELEITLLSGALEKEIPVVGVCRGLQLLNVVTGGTLHQDVPAHSRYDVPIVDLIHDVNIDDGSALNNIYGSTIGVNTLHHQTVDKVGANLTVTATAPDGTIEGLEMDGHDVIAVQWHPEMLEGDDPIFVWLVERARANKAASQTAD